MKNKGRIYLILLTIILLTNCIQYNVYLNFNYEKGLNIKESYIIDKSFFSSTDSILSDSMFSDSYKISENDSFITIYKETFIDTSELKNHGIEYYKTKNDYFINIDPKSDIFIFNRKNMNIQIFDSFKIFFISSHGRVLNNNADIVHNDTLIFNIEKNKYEDETEYPKIRVRFKNSLTGFILIFLAFIIIGIIFTVIIIIAKERH